MEDLLKLPVCHGGKTAQLHLIYDKTWVNLRGLELMVISMEVS